MCAEGVSLTLRISGMNCRACEQRIENVLLSLQGVKSVNASYVDESVRVIYDDREATPNSIKQVIESLHYGVVNGHPIRGKSQRDWIVSLVVSVSLISGYLFLLRTGSFNVFPVVEQGMALPVLFIVGLLTSVHCIAMCGGINIAQCVNVAPTDSDKKYQKILPGLLYNGGRVVSYTVIGGVVGALGAVVTPSGTFKGVVMLVAGLFMLAMGMNMLGLFPFLRKIIPHIPKSIAKRINSKKNGKGPFIVGLLNGLMPCGPLQAMQLYALSTGSAVMGAASMFLFSLGTVPLMLGLGALSSFLSARFTAVMMEVSAVLIMFLGVMMLNSGLSLSGMNPLF